MKITRSKLRQMELKEVENIMYIESIVVGKTWKTKRWISIGLLCPNDPSASIKVVGKPRQGNFNIYAGFPLTEEGFEDAKKFALLYT